VLRAIAVIAKTRAIITRTVTLFLFSMAFLIIYSL
jgi:hypothetical protein